MSEQVIPQELQDFVFSPTAWRRNVGFGRSSDETRCAAGIGRNADEWQCARIVKHTIHGFGFCTQHAQMVRKRLENEK